MFLLREGGNHLEVLVMEGPLVTAMQGRKHFKLLIGEGSNVTAQLKRSYL